MFSCEIFKNTIFGEHLLLLLLPSNSFAPFLSLPIKKNRHPFLRNFQSDANHCVKSVQIRIYFWSVFSCVRTEYRKIRTRNNPVFSHFSCSEVFSVFNLFLDQQNKKNIFCFILLFKCW